MNVGKMSFSVLLLLLVLPDSGWSRAGYQVGSPSSEIRAHKGTAYGEVLSQSDPCPTGVPGSILWSFQSQGTISGAPAVGSDGTIYFGTTRGHVYAVTCQGELRWRFDMADHSQDGAWARFEGSAAIGDSGTLYIGDDMIVPNFFVAIEPDGSLRWLYETHDVNSAMDASPALDQHERIFTGSQWYFRGGSGGTILAFDREGSRLPGFPFDTGEIEASPVALSGDRVVYVANSATRFIREQAHLPLLLARAPPHGRTSRVGAAPAQRPWHTLGPARLHIITAGRAPGTAVDLGEADVVSSPAAVGDTEVFYMRQVTPHGQEEAPRLFAYNVGGPVTMLWSHATSGDVAGSPVLGAHDPAGGRIEVFFTDSVGQLVALDASTRVGESPTTRWTVDVPPPSGEARAAHSAFFAQGAPALGDDGLVYVATGGEGEAQVKAVRREDGHEEWALNLGEEAVSTVATLAPGALYVGTRDGKLYAVATASGGLDPNAAWPSFRHDARNSGRADP